MKTTPEWLGLFLQYALWNQWELLNILCGFSPLARDVVMSKDEMLQEAKCRQDADRHVKDAIRIGELVVEPTIADRELLDKITPHVEDPAVLDRINRAAAAARLYGDAYDVRVDVAIRWAVSRKALFPRCPLSLELLAGRALSAQPGGPEKALDAPVKKTDGVCLHRPDKHWDIHYRGHVKRGLRDIRGFHLIRTLLEAPNEFIDAITLQGIDPAGVSYGSPIIDAKAGREYEARLRAIGEERKEAEDNSVRQLELDHEAEEIGKALQASTGLRGPRRIGNDRERARKAALRNYETALKTLAQELPELHEHLSSAVKTGQSFRYAPSADQRWKTRP